MAVIANITFQPANMCVPMKNWNRLPRETTDAPSLNTFKPDSMRSREMSSASEGKEVNNILLEEQVIWRQHQTGPEPAIIIS